MLVYIKCISNLPFQALGGSISLLAADTFGVNKLFLFYEYQKLSFGGGS